MTRFLKAAMIGLVSLALVAGCSKDKEEKPAEVSKVTLRLATQHPIEHMAQSSAERIKAAIEKGTEGRVTIQIFPANQLGDASQIYEEVIRGSIDAAHITVPDQFDARLGIGFIPYIAGDVDELKKVFATDAFIPTEISKIHEALGVKFFSYYGEGFTGVGTTKEATNLLDLGKDKGIVIRVPGLDVWMMGVKTLGFRTTSLPYVDVYSALQTGVVDGWAGGPPNLNYLGFRDVIKFYYQLNNNFESTQYVMNLKTFNSLTEADRKVVADAFISEGQNSFNLSEAEDVKYRKMLADAGIKVVEFTKEELKAMQDYVRQNAWPELEKNLTSELVNGLKASYK